MRLIAIIILFSSVFSINLEASNRFWVASSSGNWNDTANWASSSGGSSGASVPGSSDIAIFDGNSRFNCYLDMNISVQGIKIGPNYEDTISQSTYLMVIGANDFRMESGVFIGGTNNIEVQDDFVLDGGNFISTSGELLFKGLFEHSGGEFIHNNATFHFSGTGDQNFEFKSSSIKKFYNVIIDMAAGKKLVFKGGDTLYVENNLTLNSGKTKDAVISVKGDVEVNVGYEGENSTTLVFCGSNNQNFDLTDAENHFLGDVVLYQSNASKVNLTSDFIMELKDQELTLRSGILVSSASNLFTMEHETYWAGGNDSSFVKGPMKKIGKEAFTFPVGDSTFFAPISISQPDQETDSYQAEYIKGNADTYYDVNSKDSTIDHITGAEYWTLDRTNGTKNVTVNLSWAENRSGVITDMADMLIVRWDASLARWKDMGNGGTTGTFENGTVTTSDTTGNFGPFTFASTSLANPLPIELVEMDVDYSNGKADIYWMTATEVNNDYFEVEKKVDGGEWYKIKIVEGAGNSNVYTNYKIVDKNVNEGVNSYRLKQVDYDGKFEYFDPVSVNVVHHHTNNTFLAYPNPTDNVLNLRSETNSLNDIRIYNSAGKEVFPTSQMINGELVFDLKTFPSGIYLIKSPNGDYARIFKTNSIKAKF